MPGVVHLVTTSSMMAILGELHSSPPIALAFLVVVLATSLGEEEDDFAEKFKISHVVCLFTVLSNHIVIHLKSFSLFSFPACILFQEIRSYLYTFY